MSLLSLPPSSGIVGTNHHAQQWRLDFIDEEQEKNWYIFDIFVHNSSL
jgi:hypothetical protein